MIDRSTRTKMTKPFIGAVVFNRIKRVLGPMGGRPILFGWEWADGDRYTWVSEWL